MPIKIYPKNRAARKNSSIFDRSGLSRVEPLKQLRRAKKSTSGRGSEGKITIRHRGGGVKRQLRVIDFHQDKVSVPGKIEYIEFDPNRSAFIARVVYADGERRYVLAWEGAQIGDTGVTEPKAAEKPGNRMQLQHITAGAEVHNVELRPGRGGQLFRSAGSAGILMDIQGDHALITLPSSEVRLIPKDSYATLGRFSNVDWWLTRFGSAGRMRRL